MLIALIVPLGLSFLVYAIVLGRAALAQRVAPRAEAIVLGAVTCFFDTLGVGSFATTTAWLKFRRLVPDRMIPPTLLVGLTPPAIAQSIIYLILLGALVDPTLLVGSAVATFLGGLVGAPLVVRTRVWIIQAVVAAALLFAATAYTMTNLHVFPGGGTASGLPFLLTTVAIIFSFVFGLLANFGIGNYAPMLIMFSLMGMDPRFSFPIMAAGGSLMGVGASVRHIQIGEIDLKIVVGLALGGIPAVFVAALIVKSMPLELLRWLVIAVVLYAAAVMARAAVHGRRDHKAEAATAPIAAP